MREIYQRLAGAKPGDAEREVIAPRSPLCRLVDDAASRPQKPPEQKRLFPLRAVR
jgi:hypothetical protein